MGDVKISGGRTRDNAVSLLAAADALDLPRNVVRVTINGFEVPEEVAKAAGFDPEPSGSLTKDQEPTKAPPKVKEPEFDRTTAQEPTEAPPAVPEPEASTTVQSLSEDAEAPKAPAKKTAAKKTAAKKAPAKKTAAKKTAASKE